MFISMRIAGHLDTGWSEWFEGLEMRHLSDGSTELSGLVVDQAALYGLLRRAQDLGLALVEVTVEATGAGASPEDD